MAHHFVQAVHRATHRIGLYLDALPGQRLSQGEAHILALLAESSSASVADLHRGLAHKRSTLTSILDRLAARGLILRAPGESDRRTFIITPTAKGRRLAQQVQKYLGALESAVSRHASPAEIRGFAKVISLLENEAHERVKPGGEGRPR